MIRKINALVRLNMFETMKRYIILANDKMKDKIFICLTSLKMVIKISPI